MRTFALVVFAAMFSCSPLTAECKAGSCPAGEHCVFLGSATSPRCTPACDLADGGGCTPGQQCGCGASCQGCKDCVAVCTP